MLSVSVTFVYLRVRNNGTTRVCCRQWGAKHAHPYPCSLDREPLTNTLRKTHAPLPPRTSKYFRSSTRVYFRSKPTGGRTRSNRLLIQSCLSIPEGRASSHQTNLSDYSSIRLSIHPFLLSIFVRSPSSSRLLLYAFERRAL